MIVYRAGVCLTAVFPLALLVGITVTADPKDASAQCILNAGGFRCVGVDADGVEDGRPGSVGLIGPGARIGGQVAVDVGDDATVLLDQDALLDGILDGIGILAGDDVTVINDGGIGGNSAFSFGFGGTGPAIEVGDDATITNGAEGAISSGGGLIFAGDGLTFTNAGEVGALAANGGISADDDATIINTGEFFGQENLLSAGDDLTVINTGEMSGFFQGIGTGERFRLTNSGTIRTGIPIDAGADAAVSNAGVIEGSIFAITLGPDGIITNEPGGVIRLTSAGSDEAIRAQGNLKVENGGVIEAVSGDAIRATGDLRIRSLGGEIVASDDAIVADGDVTVLNESTPIVAGDRAIVAGGVVGVDVYGDITAGGVGIEGGDGSSVTIVDNDTVSAAGDAVRLGRSSSVFLDNSQSTIETTGVGTTALTMASGDIYNAFGNILAPRGVAIDIGFGVDGDEPTGDLDFLNFGDVIGLIGIRTAPGDTARQEIRNDGEIIGTSGVAIDLGGGNDFLEQFDTISGDVFLGDGNDELRFLANASEEESLFDGGAGFDVARLFGVASSDVLSLPIDDGVVLSFLDEPERASLTLRGFERLAFEDTTLTAGLAPIPLPAGLPMLAGAMGFLFVLRRTQGL